MRVFCGYRSAIMVGAMVAYDASPTPTNALLVVMATNEQFILCHGRESLGDYFIITIPKWVDLSGSIAVIIL